MDIRTWQQITMTEKQQKAMLKTLPGALANALDRALYDSTVDKPENVSSFHNGYLNVPERIYLGLYFGKENKFTRHDKTKGKFLYWPGLEEDSEYCSASKLLREIKEYLDALAFAQVTK